MAKSGILFFMIWVVVWPLSLDATMIHDQAHVLSGSSEKAIRENILLLNIGELQADAALERLRAAPRNQVVAVLRDELIAEPVKPSDRNLRAIFALNLIELLPELRKITERTDLWLVFVTANHLFDMASKDAHAKDLLESFAKLYQQRFSSELSAASRVAILDGLTQLRVPLKAELFQAVLDDNQLQVRVAAIENLLATRDLLLPEDRLRRMHEALQMKPFQARLLALRSLPLLDKNENRKLLSRLPANICVKENRPEVRKSCRNVLNAGTTK